MQKIVQPRNPVIGVIATVYKFLTLIAMLLVHKYSSDFLIFDVFFKGLFEIFFQIYDQLREVTLDQSPCMHENTSLALPDVDFPIVRPCTTGTS